MKLKNIKVGDKLEVKKSIADDSLNDILTAGDIVEVKFVEPESYKGNMTVQIVKNEEIDWANHKHLRKPKNDNKPKIGDEYVVVSAGDSVARILHVGTRHTILSKGLSDCSFTLDSRFIATPVGDDRLEIRGLNTFLEKVSDKPKTLDQSVFEGLDEKWQFAAVDANGNAYIYMSEPSLSGRYFVGGNGADYELVGESYDTSNWQNSLIERESKEIEVNVGDEFVVISTHSIHKDVKAGTIHKVTSIDSDGDIFFDSCFQAHKTKDGKLEMHGIGIILEKVKAKVELTGSDLTRKMLEDGVTEIKCYVSDTSDEEAVNGDDAEKHGVRTVTGFGSHGFQTTMLFDWRYAVPVSSASSLPRDPKPLSRWQHRNGNIYTVTDITNQDSEDTDSHPVTVVYKSHNGEKTWSRPLSEWHESMTEI